MGKESQFRWFMMALSIAVCVLLALPPLSTIHIGARAEGTRAADGNNDAATSVEVFNGDVMEGNLNDGDDQEDWFKINLTAGEEIYANLSVPGGADFDLYLLNATEDEMDASETAEDFEEVWGTVNRTGIYYIVAEAATGNGDYTLEITATANWTFLVYMDGDCDLETSAIEDFLEMSQVGSTTEVNIAVQFDRDGGYDASYGDWNQTLRYLVEWNMTPTEANATEDIGEVNMGDNETLYDFLNWSILNYPAHNYALVFWNHGMHWYGVCSDNTSEDDHLNMSEIDEALWNVYNYWDNFTFDIIDFDACLMAAVEVAYQISDYGDYMIASEKTEPGAGLAYNVSLSTLVNKSNISPLDFCQELLTDYSFFYQNTFGTEDDYLLNRSYTLSIINLSNVDELVNATDDLAMELYDNTDLWFNYLNYTRNITETYDGPFGGEEKIIDLYDFARYLNGFVNNGSMIQLTGDVMAALLDAVVNETHGTNPENSEVTVNNATGLTIYYPEFDFEYDENYTADGFFYFPQHTWWPDMLMESYLMGINSGPVIDSHLPASENVSMEEGDTVEFELDVSDADDNYLMYFWHIDEELVEGEYNSTFSFETEEGDAGEYEITGFVFDGPMNEEAIEKGFTSLDFFNWSVQINESMVTGDNWTFMVYLDGDCDLEPFAISDMNEMEAIGSTDDVNIVALVDRWDGTGADLDHPDDTSNGDWTEARIYYIEKDNDTSNITSTMVSSEGELNMGDPDTLVDFAENVHDNYPAQHYALIFWDHGMGWPGVCPDDSHAHDALELTELDAALDEITTYYGKNLDLIGFDACLMAMLEVDHEIAEYADFRVASEELEPGDGLLYEDFLDDLVATPSMTPESLAKLMTSSFISSYTDGLPGPEDSGDVTQSAVRLALVEPIVTALDNLTSLLIAGIDTFSEEIMMARYLSQDFGGDSESVDLADFAGELKDLVDDTAIETAATILKNAVSAAVIREGHGPERPDAAGIAIYFPENEAVAALGEGYYDTDYDDISFAQDTSWDDFLLALYTAFGANLPPEVEVLSPEEDIVAEVDEILLFSVNATDPEDEGNLTYTWYQNGTELVNDTGIVVDGDMLSLVYSENDVGNWYIITLTVADVWGYENRSSAVWYVDVIPPSVTTGYLAGTVNDTLGMPIANVSVSLQLNMTTWLNTTTDGNGDYLIGNITPSMTLYPVNFTMLHYVAVSKEIQVKEPREIYILNVTMTKITWGTLTGLVVFMNEMSVERPVEGASVSLSRLIGNNTTWPSPNQTTDATGVFLYAEIPGAVYTLTITKNGFKDHVETVTLVRDTIMDLGNITLEEGLAVLTGTITFSDGNPNKANATVTVVGTGLSALTAKDYLINNIQPANYNITATAEGYAAAMKVNFTLKPGTNVLHFTLTPKNNTITLGPFLDEKKAPIANVTVSIMINNKTYSGKTDASGMVTIDIGMEVVAGMILEGTATADGMKPITFQVNGSSPGLTVFPHLEEKSDKPEEGMNMTLIIVIVVVVLVVIAAVLFFVMKPRKKEKEEPVGDKTIDGEAAARIQAAESPPQAQPEQPTQDMPQPPPAADVPPPQLPPPSDAPLPPPQDALPPPPMEIGAPPDEDMPPDLPQSPMDEMSAHSDEVPECVDNVNQQRIDDVFDFSEDFDDFSDVGDADDTLGDELEDHYEEDLEDELLDEDLEDDFFIGDI